MPRGRCFARWHGWLAAAALLASTILLLASALPRPASETAPPAVEAGSRAPATRSPGLGPGGFVLAGLTVGSGSGPRASHFAADRLHLAKRRSVGGLFVYDNLLDATLMGASARLRLQPPDPEAPLDVLAGLSDLIDLVIEDRGSLSSARLERGRDILSRLRFHGLSVEVELAAGGAVEIVGGKAEADPELETLAFQGPVTLRDIAGRELRAAEAIWSQAHAGFRVPSGHRFEGEARSGPAFFVLEADGSLRRREPPPDVAYRDEIAEMESDVAAMVLGDLPFAVRAALGLAPAP